MAWKVDRVMAAWGISFGILATLSGMFVLEAVEGGFLAEGFFLLVLGWILFFAAIAKLISKMRDRRIERKE